LINAVKNSVGLTEGKLLFGGTGNLSGKIVWGALDDVVMGGVSESTFQIQPTGSETDGPTGLFKGTVSTSNNGGFTSIRTKVPTDMYFPKKKKNKVAAVLCVDLYFISMS
jgi:hypothetical protein